MPLKILKLNLNLLIGCSIVFFNGILALFVFYIDKYIYYTSYYLLKKIQ